MKVLEKHAAFEDWKLEVTCKDSGWRNENVNCGSKLEVNKNDILYRVNSKYPDEETTTYGVICPVCNSYTEINEKLIPEEIKQSARSYLEVIKGNNSAKDATSEKDDIGEDPCKLKGCTFETRQTCAGCKERVEWERKKKEKTKADESIDDMLNQMLTLSGDAIEIMEGLENSDCFQRIVIYDSDFEKFLEEHDLASKNAKGSYCKTKKFDIEWPKIENRYYEQLDKDK